LSTSPEPPYTYIAHAAQYTLHSELIFFSGRALTPYRISCLPARDILMHPHRLNHRGPGQCKKSVGNHGRFNTQARARGTPMHCPCGWLLISRVACVWPRVLRWSTSHYTPHILQVLAVHPPPSRSHAIEHGDVDVAGCWLVAGGWNTGDLRGVLRTGSWEADRDSCIEPRFIPNKMFPGVGILGKLGGQWHPGDPASE
jgi:hypothetical protein